jgi:valyl-tRNA synthetase
MLSCSPAGNDLLFDVSLCDQGKKFCNKMWNALRLIKSWEPEDKSQSKVNKMAVTWFADLLNKRIAEQEASFAKNKLSEGLISLYSLIWTDFCSWYLELIKPSREGGIDRQTYDQTIELFSDLMIMLHPYMPFVSEELWHELAEREENNDCMVSSYPKSGDFDVSTISAFEEMKTLVSKVREVRNSKGIKRNEELELHILKGTKPEWFESDIMHCVMKAAFTGQITEIDDVPDGATGFTTGRSKWYLILNQEIDVEKELERLNAELDHNRKFVAGISKKLDNPGFVNNAPEAVVAMERKKLADGQARIENLEKSIAALQ